MKRMTIANPAEIGALLSEAAQRRTHTALTYPSGTGWATGKGLLIESEAGGRTFQIQPLPEPEEPAPVFSPGQYVGVALRRGHRKCLFCSSVVRGSGSGGRSCVVLGWPDHVQVLQRRMYYRMEVPADREVVAALVPRRHERFEERLLSEAEATVARVLNVSVGGCAVVVEGPPPAGWVLGGTFWCRLRDGDRKLPVLEANWRHITAGEGGQVIVGFQFVGLEFAGAGSRAMRELVQLVGELARRAGRERPFTRTR